KNYTLSLHDALLITKTKVHQLIESEMKLGSQAKRMLKKAEKSGFTIQETKNWEGIIAIVESELTEKINEFNKLNLSRLRKLTQRSEEHTSELQSREK